MQKWIIVFYTHLSATMKAISVSSTPVLQFVFPEDKTPYVQEHMHKEETTAQLRRIWQELRNSNFMVFSYRLKFTKVGKEKWYNIVFILLKLFAIILTYISCNNKNNASKLKV